MAKNETKEPGETIEAWEVTISGTYRKDSLGGYVDFQDVVGIIPLVEYEIMEQMARKRYAPMWLAKDPSVKTGIKSVREVHIDSAELVQVPQHSFVGKNILVLSYEELQDLAVAKDLRTIPLYKKSGLKFTRDVAYAAYARNVLKLTMESDPNKTDEQNEHDYNLLTDHRTVGFNSAKNPKIIINATRHVDKTKKITNEEVIANSQKGKDTSSTFSLDELKAVADSKGIVYPANIGKDKLYAKIFMADNAA